MIDITDQQQAFLVQHVWGQLATTRNSGAPQVSMVAYAWDGRDLAISCRSGAAKFVNAKRRPQVVFTVADDADCLTMAGTATCFTSGLERDSLTERVRDRLRDGEGWAADMLDRDIDAGLDAARRVIIRVAPVDVTLVQPRH